MARLGVRVTHLLGAVRKPRSQKPLPAQPVQWARRAAGLLRHSPEEEEGHCAHQDSAGSLVLPSWGRRGQAVQPSRGWGCWASLARLLHSHVWPEGCRIHPEVDQGSTDEKVTG